MSWTLWLEVIVVSATVAPSLLSSVLYQTLPWQGASVAQRIMMLDSVPCCKYGLRTIRGCLSGCFAVTDATSSVIILNFEN